MKNKDAQKAVFVNISLTVVKAGRVMLSVIPVVLRYANVPFWRPAFNILRDHEMLPLPDDFVSMFL
ncbi:hypothetical protein CTI12_AA207940 [Artemisia annua]|uniref:Uncharacterized protein n=1 Tax=Artemisia annua TaxID=35608 RepID=A0A2U1MFH4_ARTAN|nr:hypothetical protein CTI12_AA207940 [Artemisia annua]